MARLEGALRTASALGLLVAWTAACDQAHPTVVEPVSMPAGETAAAGPFAPDRPEAAAEDPGTPQELPLGRWTVGRSELCLEVLPAQALRISVRHPESARDPTVVEAGYRAVPLGDGRWRVTIEPRSIHRKELASCRDRWVDAPVEQTTVLGARLARGAAVTLTLRFTEARDAVEVCGPGDLCRRLEGRSVERTCHVSGRIVHGTGLVDPSVRVGGVHVAADVEGSWPGFTVRLPEDRLLRGAVVARDRDGLELPCGTLR